MPLKLIELNPNRLLLDSSFDGYKLSLQEIPKKNKELPSSVDRVLLNTHQYSVLHANLYGFHNHLISDPFDQTNSVYFAGTDFNICKVYIDPFSDDLIDPIPVLELPRARERKTGDYNVSLRFVSASLAVIGDGCGTLFIINTGNRNDDDNFQICFSDEVAGQDEPFLVVDAILKLNNDGNQELHVLALSLKQVDKNERFFTVLHWVTFSKENDMWGQVALKQIKTKGCIQYSYLEKKCQAVYVVSDDECKFVLNSDVPMLWVPPDSDTKQEKVYSWLQSSEIVTIRCTLPENVATEKIKVKTDNKNIDIAYDDRTLLIGELYKEIDSDSTTWTCEENVLKVKLNKVFVGDMWPEVVKNDDTGEYITEQSNAEVSNRIISFTSETEEIPQGGTTFNSQEVEECDFEADKAVTFERLCAQTNTTTHKVNLGSHQVLLTAFLNPDARPSMGIRHDVDICLWQPESTENDFTFTHEGTLLALGYVQASKQNRKFSVCPPNMSYAVICESTGHLFIYRQNKVISSSELRNRSTGKMVKNIAQQQVVNISNEEVLGIYAANNNLFLLCEKSISVLNL